MSWRVLLGLCLFWPCAFAEWPTAPTFDVDAECPRCPQRTASESAWDSYGSQLDEFLKLKLEAFWTDVNTAYRLGLEKQRRTFDSALNSGQITFEEYRKSLDEYRFRIAKIPNDFFNIYSLGLNRYRSGMRLYEAAKKAFEKSQFDMNFRDEAGRNVRYRWDCASSCSPGTGIISRD